MPWWGWLAIGAGVFVVGGIAYGICAAKAVAGAAMRGR